jgi:hypothetical protein
MAKDLFEEAGVNAATDLFAEAGIKFEQPRKKEEPIDLSFSETDIKKAQEQLRVEPIIGLPRKAPSAPPAPVAAPVAPPPQELKGLEAILAAAPKQPARPSATMPVAAEERKRVTTAWENATPAERALMEAAPGYKGVITRELAERYPKEVPKGAMSALDPRREARFEREIRKGTPPDVADYLVNVGIARGAKPGQEEAALFPGKVEQTDVDFEIAKTFAKPGLDNPLARGATKGVLGLNKAALGVNLAITDALGLEETGKDMMKYANKVRGTEEGLGEKGTFLERNLEGAISSIAQQAPALLGGAITGKTAIALGSMIVNSFGQEYSDGRAKGLDGGSAAARAGLYAAFEGIGERFGIKGNLSAIRKIADGMPLDAAKEFLSNTLKKELPGELFTTTGQFVTDLAPGIGLNPNATFKDYLGAVGDTVAQTIMQGGIMSGASRGLAKLQERGPSEGLQYAEAESARDSAIRAWEKTFAPLKQGPKLGKEQPLPTSNEPNLGAVTIVPKVEPTVGGLTAPPGLVEEAEIEQPSIKEAFQGAAKGMTENLYQGIFEAQQKGETKVSGIDEPVLIAAKESGITFKTPEEVQAFANDPKVQARLKEINIEQQVQRMVQNGQTVGQIQQKLPNVDVLKMLGVIDKLPMGDNVEYHIVKTKAGYAANMFDVDSGNYVPGSTRIFSTKNFGDQAEAKAREFAQGEINKVPPEAPVEEPQEETIKVEGEKPEVKSWINKVYERFPDTFQNNHVMILGGEGENQQFAMFELTPGFSQAGPTVDVKWISAHPQRQGVGTRAMEVLKDMAREDGVSLTLYAWDKGQVSQNNLIKFYKKQGFTPKSKGSKSLIWSPEQESTQKSKTPVKTPVVTPEAGTPEGPPTEPLTEDDLNKMFEELAEEAPDQTKQLSEQDLDAMFEEIAAGKTPPKVEKRAPQTTEPTTAPTVPGLLGSAAKETGTGLAKSIDALGELFGGKNTLGSGPVFDDETYAKAKPIFLEAISHLKQAASDIRQAMKMIIDMVKAKFGQPVLERMKKYVIRFIQDIQSGAIKTETPTEQVEEAKPDLLTPEGKFQVAQELADYLIGDGSFKTIVEARQKIGEITGQKIEPGTELAKQADETVETAIVLAAREIVKGGRKRGNNVTYDRLVGLLGRQPNLSVRSSESIRDQAYSTPVPLAYLASELAGVTPESKVLEPTAGNGMLLIGASVNNAIANELNPTRAAMMRAIGFTVTTQNAATSELTKPKSQDVVIANPPFGSTKDADGKTISFTVKDGYTTNEIDHAIVFKSLEAMKDDGRAVLIVGGVLPTTEEGRTDAYRGAAKRAFYYNLYNQYNVVDHFTVAGDLYAKQGASYPVDVIVIEGRGESERSLPAADLPKIYNSWDELKEKLNGRVVPTRIERPVGPPSGEDQTGAGNGESVAGGAGGQGAGTGGEGGAGGNAPSEPNAGPTTNEPGVGGGVPSTGELEPTGVPPSVSDEKAPVPGEGGVQPRRGTGTGNQPEPVGRPSGISGQRVISGIKDRRGQEEETETQVEYVPKSSGASVGTLSPVAMQQATQESLERLVEKHGDIDNYVAEALQVDVETLHINLSAEQIDALGLAIDNAEQGKGFIIGDQTGIGKGRVVASMIKYALVNDKIPIFVTEGSNLYADMIRDLDAIGMKDELGLDQPMTKIFITNAGEKVPYELIRKKDAITKLEELISDAQQDLEQPEKVEYDPEIAELVERVKNQKLDRSALDDINELISYAEDSLKASNILSDAAKTKSFADIIDLAEKDVENYHPLAAIGALEKYAKEALEEVDKPSPDQKDALRKINKLIKDAESALTKAQETIQSNRPDIIKTEFQLRSPVSGKNAVQDFNRMMVAMRDNDSLGDFRVIFTTYDQMATQRGQMTERQRFISHFATGNYIILDESHNAGGSPSNEDKVTVASFVRGLVNSSFGSFFSSATYAKRPDVMSLYSSTNMSLAVDNIEQLSEAIKGGGVPMQQAVATMLTKDGQYIRRERTFAGVSYDTVATEVDKETAESMASAMRDILQFSRLKASAVSRMQAELDQQGAVVRDRSERTMIQQVNFGSTMHNLIDQMLLALKTDKSIDFAIDRLRRNEKVVLTVANTMGSFLGDYASDNEIKTGEPIDLSFQDLFLNYLLKQRTVTIKDPNGNKTKRILTDEDLGPSLTRFYNDIVDHINESGFGAAPISPIDYMHFRLREAGFSTGEITGRTVTINYGMGVPVLGSRSAQVSDRVNAVKKFNNGTLDVLILNQAGSTGLSLHANIDVFDRRKRHMILVQPEKNIDTHMQMLGRVHRTGQVVTPSYSQMMADIPAEMRPAAVLMKKMASLNANTTASRKSAVTTEGVVDFMNDYGGQVIQEYLRDNPNIYQMLGGPDVLTLVTDPTENPKEEDIRKVTGYIPMLPIAEQEKAYADIVARYNDLIAVEDSLGQNRLEAKEKDLDAQTLSSEPVTEPKEEASLFAAPAIMERVDVKKAVKPYSSDEVNEMVRDNLGGKDGNQFAIELINSLKERSREYWRTTIGNLEAQDPPDPVKIQAKKDEISGQVSRVEVILRNYRIGTQITLTNRAGIPIYGVITNITNAKRTENPAAASDWKMQVAVSNGESKSLPLSFAQVGTVYKLTVTPYVSFYNTETQSAQEVKLIETFDRGTTVRREKRWLVSGNLLAGYSKFPGQIISYTKDDGTMGQGILMNRNFDFEKYKRERPVEFKNPRDIMEFLASKSSSEVGTPDRHLTISQDRSRYIFSASKPKRGGGQYHQDPQLIEIIGQFVTRGNRMVSVVYNEDPFIAAINYLNQKGVQLIATSNQNGARELQDRKLKGSAPSGSLSANAQTRYMSGRRSSTKMSKADIEKQIQSVRERGQVPEIVVVQGIDSLPEKILNEMRASGMELAPGLFHQDSNRIFLIADNIAHPQALWMTVAHELAGHYGLRAVLGEDYAPMMNAIYDGSEEVRKNVDARLQRNRDQVKNPNLRMTKEEAVEEYVAEKAEPDPKLKWVNRLVNAIKTFLRKIGFTIPVGDSEVIRLIRDANKYTYGDAVKASWTVREAAKGREKGFARGAVRPSLATSAKDRFEAAEIDRLDEPGFKSRERLVEINIDDFLNLSDQVTEGAYTGGKLKDTRSYLKDGGKFNSLPFFQYDIDDDNVAHVVGHEGRHRALALKELGYTTMPVVLRGPIRWSEQADPNKFDYVEEFPTRLRAQEKAKNPNFTITFPVTRETADQPYSASMSRVMYRQDDEDLVDKYNRPNVPMLQANPMRDAIIDAAKTTKELFIDAAKSPKWALDKAFTAAENTVLYLRNKNIWFGAGLNARDFERYNGALEDSQGLAIASVALDNAISSGNIGVQVVMQGGLKFDATHKRFMATETPLGMVGVYKAQAELKKKLGDQLGENIIQGYLEAKRSKSIKDEYAIREQEYKDAVDAYNRALQKPDVAIQLQAKEAVDEAAADLAAIKVALDKVNMSDEEIGEFIARDQEHPELQRIMSNWTSVNQNLLKVWHQVGLLSDKRYEVLSQIPDYVPWYRIMSENDDIHSPIQSTTKTLQNIGREKVFKEGKSKIVSVFTAEAGQQTFEIQPSARVDVKVNGKRIPESKVTSNPDGNVTLNIVIRAGDHVVITANREIENIIDNMTQNVMRMTMNAVRQYAASRIVKEYGTRNAKGQIMLFKSVDPKEGTFYFVSKGKRVIVQIQDPLVAEAVLGMSSLDIEMFKPLALVANLTRRLITISPTFQLKQIFQDAPTAALVSGVKNPAAVMGGVFNGFVQSLRPSDPITDILRSAGIGGFYSPARTPEAEVKRRIGVLNNNVYEYVMRGLDHWGDASDMAQRRAVYIRVLKETGDANLALYQAANVINFLHRGSGRVAQALTKTVPFMAAYANQIDVLAQTLIGGGLKGVSRGRALARLAKTGALLSGMTLLYCFLVGDDEDYIKLDDQTRIRNFILPGTTFVIPMNTAAGFFFKAIPEMLYNTVVKYGTDQEIDGRRLRTALKEAAVDMLLGPTPLPSVIKTGIEIKLNKDFWSGLDITPKRLQNVKPEEQYTAATSEAGKILSKLSGGALNPMEMDHIVRSTFGSAGALAQYFTNVIGESQGVRAETPLKQTPLVGPFVRPEVPRGPEDLFYDLKEEVDTAYNTFKIKMDRMKDESADKFEEKNEDLISLHKIVNKTDAMLQKFNKEIRQTGESVDKDMTPKEKRAEMVDLMKEKNEVLDDIEMLRKEAGFSKDSIIHEILNRVSR